MVGFVVPMGPSDSPSGMHPHPEQVFFCQNGGESWTNSSDRGRLIESVSWGKGHSANPVMTTLFAKTKPDLEVKKHSWFEVLE